MRNRSQSPRSECATPRRAMVSLPVSEPSKAFVEQVVALRHHLHAHPEIGFEELDTSRLLRSILVDSCGVCEDAIRVMAETGLVVDLEGSGEGEPIYHGDAHPAPRLARAPDAPAGRRIIAFRTDLDALPMTERNEGLPYRSTRAGAAHST
jgi:hippurate hydrolase